MDLCIGLGLIIVFVIVGLAMLEAGGQRADAEKKRQKEEVEKRERAALWEKEEAQRREARRQDQINEEIQNIDRQKDNFDKLFRGFFSGPASAYSVYNELQDCLQSIKQSNRFLSEKAPDKMQDGLLRQLSYRANTFGRFADMVTAAFPVMVDWNNYGNVNKRYWNEVRQMDRATAEKALISFSRLIDSADIESLVRTDTTMLAKLVWFYATEKPYSAELFKRACKIFSSVYKGTVTDIIIAEFYAIKQLGGEDILRNRVREIIKRNEVTNYSAGIFSKESAELTTIASGLMWMNAYQEENMILQHMLSSGMPMSEKAQNRLHALSNGGGKAPSAFAVSSNENTLYFDVTSLSWKDDDYTGLFENLAFQDKTLAYSLAVRDEDKELMISQGITVPDKNVIKDKLNAALQEEYGGSARAKLVKGIALSGSGEERLDGILVEARECRQLGILVHVARIGKKLNIKFYTLFMPAREQLANQKQKSLSLVKKLSPSVSMWESSLKDTVLMTIQQILNTSSQSISVNVNNNNDEGVIF